MNIRNHRVSVCDHRVGICNHCVGTRNRLLRIRDRHLSTRNNRVSFRNHQVGVDCQLGLKGAAKFADANETNCTHIENVKDPDKILLPSSDLFPIVLRENESEYRIPFTLLRDLPLDTRQGSVIHILVSG
jgi:hypothetical protein